MNDKKVSVVIPVYNSAKWMDELVGRIHMELDDLVSHEIILVNDGSPDRDVWPKIEEICKRDSRVEGIDLLYNSGQFTATMCGLEYATGDYIITMDDDLQHPPEELHKLIECIDEKEYDCVFGVYGAAKENFFRRAGSQLTNGIVGKLYNRPKGIRSNSFRIMTNNLAKTIAMYKTCKPQISPLIFMCTKNIGNVLVEHKPRVYGKSGYTLKKLISATFNSVVNISTFPLDIISAVGIFSSCLAFLIALVYLVRYFLGEILVPGFTAQILVTVFFGGLILLGLGIVGKYIGRIISEITGLPRYVVRKILNGEDKDEKNIDIRNG